uniref:Uncharacterized protein n=1 Tax=Anopheles dirus TaxID=7168 RepID=A0A182N046_9DIPT
MVLLGCFSTRYTQSPGKREEDADSREKMGSIAGLGGLVLLVAATAAAAAAAAATSAGRTWTRSGAARFCSASEKNSCARTVPARWTSVKRAKPNDAFQMLRREPATAAATAAAASAGWTWTGAERSGKVLLGKREELLCTDGASEVGQREESKTQRRFPDAAAFVL